MTTPARCPVSCQPELKHAAVRVAKAELPWRLAAFGYAPEGDALALRAALRSLHESFPFASVMLIGRERPGVLFRAAAADAGRGGAPRRVDALFGLDGDAVARYDDATRGIGRRVRVEKGRLRRRPPVGRHRGGIVAARVARCRTRRDGAASACC